MRTIFLVFTVLLLSGFLPAWADAPSPEEMRSLDEQVQEIKTDVLGIAAELSSLEERLLFPSNTQVAVFISVPGEPAFRLDAVRIDINGQPAAHHIYSFKELDALQSGGLQRIFTGNLPSGAHQLQVSVVGKLPSGKDHTQTERFTFQKGIEPELLGLSVAGATGGSGAITLTNW